MQICYSQSSYIFKYKDLFKITFDLYNLHILLMKYHSTHIQSMSSGQSYLRKVFRQVSYLNKNQKY